MVGDDEFQLFLQDWHLDQARSVQRRVDHAKIHVAADVVTVLRFKDAPRTLMIVREGPPGFGSELAVPGQRTESLGRLGNRNGHAAGHEGPGAHQYDYPGPWRKAVGVQLQRMQRTVAIRHVFAWRPQRPEAIEDDVFAALRIQ